MSRKVLVMLSTYNGEKFVKEQIDSILSQKDVEVTLNIRDDGSTDNTRIELRRYKDEANVNIEYGQNIGFRKSFWHLLYNANDDFDFYAFADQDDIWNEDKILNGIKALEAVEKDICALYATGMDVVDENLCFIKKQEFPKLKISFGSALSRQRLAGCTMVFNRYLFNLCKKFDLENLENNIISHDGLVYYSCLICGGRVIFDKSSSMLFRRHSSTVTELGKGLLAKVNTLFKIFKEDKNKRYKQVKYLNEILDDYIDQVHRNHVYDILNYRSSFLIKLRLVLKTDINCNLVSVDFINRIAILFNCY